MDSNLSQKPNNTYCCVPQCKSKGSKTPKLSFHKFPNVKSVVRKTALDGRLVLVNRRNEWRRLLKIGKEVSNRMSVCSKHFDKDSYTFPPEKCKRPRLKASALPSLYLPVTTSYSEEKKTLKKKDSAKRLARYSEINRKKFDCPLKSCLEKKKAAPSIFPNFHACDRSLKDTSLDEMKLGEEQNTSAPPENIPLEAMSDSNVPINERQENGRKFPGRPRKRKRGPFRSIHKKEKDISESSQRNCDEITSSNGITTDQNSSLSISSKKRGPFKSIYNENKDTSTDSQMNCYEISSSSGNVTDLNVSSSLSTQLLPNVRIKEEKPWQEEYNYFGNSSSYLSRDSNKMQIEINDVRSVPSTGSFSDGKMTTNQGKVPGSLSKPLKVEPREEVFGKLVACEMSDLCGNPELYLKTKQAILNLLVQARFDQMKQNGEIL